MKAPNHIAGGILFTGIIASIWDVNVFHHTGYITACVFGTLFPDIDTTKSLIGKILYPIAKPIAKRFGHRTITHSIPFATLTFIALKFIENTFQTINNIAFIFFLAILSHLFFDMMTKAGIPLFYPFKKNPCVIPGKIEYRIKNGSNAEYIAFLIFIAGTFTFSDLFANGFWTTYNKQFNDIKHLEREFKRSPNILNVNYQYDLFQNSYSGTGFVVYADFQQSYILEQNKVTHLQEYTQGLIIKKLELNPNHKKILLLHNKQFTNISLDSLNQLLQHIFIAQATFYSSKNCEAITKNNGLLSGKFFELQNEYNLHFIESIQNEMNQKIYKKDTSKIENLKYKIHLEQKKINRINQQHQINQYKLNKLQKQLDTIKNLYTINHTQTQIINLKKKINQHKPPTKEKLQQLSRELNIELEKLKLQTTPEYSEIKFTGQIKYFTYKN